MSNLGRNDACWCGSGEKYKKCHLELDAVIDRYARQGIPVPNRKLLKTPGQIEGIRQSSAVNIALLDYIADFVEAGVSTGELDRLIEKKTAELGGIPAPLNYNGFPKSSCISIDEVVCHGIPSDGTILKDGDIVNIDLSTTLGGYFSDSSRMFCIGEVSPEKRRLVEVARECMELGVGRVKPWGRLGDIGQVVSDHAAANGCTVVREIGGHGVGLAFHEDPWVSYVSREGTGMLLVPGMVFTVEPMVNMGKAAVVTDEEDGWTVRTADGKPSAQWEKTVLVTADGCEVLTY
ncbi:MAG: methionyl aminopeptidase [Oscillospiraceae bacterium]